MRGLDLCTRHRRRVANAAQVATAADAQRRQSPPSCHRCGHPFRQRIDHAPHRPSRQRCVADEHGIEALSGEQSCQQSHAGAGVAAIDRRCGSAQSMQSDTVHNALVVAWRFDVHAHVGECPGRRPRVLAFEKSGDSRRTHRNRGEHDRAMRNRFVARHDARRRAAADDGALVQSDAAAAHGNASRNRWFSARVPMLMRNNSGKPVTTHRTHDHAASKRCLFNGSRVAAEVDQYEIGLRRQHAKSAIAQVPREPFAFVEIARFRPRDDAPCPSSAASAATSARPLTLNDSRKRSKIPDNARMRDRDSPTAILRAHTPWRTCA